MSNSMNFIMAQLQDKVSDLAEIVTLFIAQREGLEAESLEELRDKLIKKYWDEVQSSASTVRNEE